MAWRIEKETGDIVISGFDQGIASSPEKGIANMQGVNISTIPGEVMTSYLRTQQSMTSTSSTGTLSFSDSSHVGLSLGNNRLKGMWITVSSSTHTGELNNGNYYVLPSSGSGFQLASTYNGSIITGYTSGLTAVISLLQPMGKPVARASEIYQSGANTRYRYYVLDANGVVFVYDTTNDAIYSSSDNVTWLQPDALTSYFGSQSAPSGIVVYNGFLHVFAGNQIFCKPTSDLGNTSSATTNWVKFASGNMMSPPTNANPHFAYVGHQGKLYYTDGVYLGSIFANTSLIATTTANIQSFCSYTGSSTTGTASLITGSIPYNGTDNSIRIPAVFFAQAGGTVPSALTAGTLYYIKWLGASTPDTTFEVYAASSGGSALNVATGSSGTQYFSTYHPTYSGGESVITFTPQRLNLPSFETAQCMAEIGNLLVIGGKTPALYPWSQVNATPDSVIPTPEGNISNIVGVNNVAYYLAGNKGNIYVTSGSVASLVTKIPDYCAGIAGETATYVEPYFTWGDIMYLRGRIYVSILDQTSNKSGNCGGVWSFVPTQNYFVQQDTGIALRLENQNSYETYNGYCPVLIPAYTQSAKSPQYWSAWEDGISSPNYGIDFTSTQSGTVATIETDLIPTGTMLKKRTFEQVEYKLSAPLDSGATVSIKYRNDATSAFTAFTSTLQTDTSYSGYYQCSFQNTQWLQLQITLSPITSSSATTNSFVRLTEIRVR